MSDSKTACEIVACPDIEQGDRYIGLDAGVFIERNLAFIALRSRSSATIYLTVSYCSSESIALH